MNIKRRVRTAMTRFLSSRKAIVWVWASVFLAMVLYSICWFTFGIAWIKLVGVIEANYDFVGGMLQTKNLIKNLVIWHPVFTLGGYLVYGIVNSAMREYTEVPR